MIHENPNVVGARPGSGEAASQPVPLTSLRSGQLAWLYATDDGCADCELLCAMGMTERCPIRLCRMGEPCIVQAGATRMGIARSVASSILVTLASSERTLDHPGGGDEHHSST